MEGIKDHDDSLLVSELKNGSFKAFEALYNLYKKKLYNFSFQYLKNHDETEELLQAVFVSLWEHRQNLDSSLPVKNFLYRCTTNKIYDQLRKQYVHNRYVDHKLRNQETHDSDTIENIYLKELQESLNKIMEELPEQQRNVFFLSRYQYLSNKEIAAKLNISVRTVETQIYRVIKKIKNKLKI